MDDLKNIFDPVIEKDIEVIRTTAFCSKMNKNQLGQLLTEAYEQNEDTYTKLSYALFNLCANTSNDALESKSKVESALFAIEEILEDDPRYWLAWLYKIRILIMLPMNYRDEDEIIQELLQMIEIQDNSKYMPYFIAPYILLGELYLQTGENTKAQKIIEEIEKFDDIGARNYAPILRPILISFVKKSSALKQLDILEKVVKIKERFLL